MNILGYNTSEVLSEKEKSSEEYLKSCIDKAITELVYDKDYLRKAYNYYNCIRDKDQFRHLEENFGIGNPTSIEFIPLVKRHVDALVGELILTKLKPKITCKDSETLMKINEDSKKAIYEAEIKRLQQQLVNNIQGVFSPQDPNQPQQGQPVDKASEEEISKIKDMAKRDFISDYEIAAQNMIEFFLQSRDVDLNSKREILFKDLLVGGQCYYRTKTKKGSSVPTVEVLNPFDIFPEYNVNETYVNKSRRIVYVKYMCKEEIINECGDYMSKKEIEDLLGVNMDLFSHNVYYVRAESGGIVSNVETTIPGTYPYYNDTYLGNNKYPVYFVEWLENNQVGEGEERRFRMDRYKGARIGTDIYLNMGKDENVTRTMEDPYNCTLTVNGVQLTSRSGKPFSMVLSTANLQDRYDLLHWYRDTLIANSGTKGDWLDTALLPAFLGQSSEERLLKFKAYKKAGLALFNSAQEGRERQPMNTTFSGFDDTVDGNSIQAIQLAIQQTEDICSAITGVFREKLGDIEQRDAVTNVQTGIKNSAVITKQYFNTLDGVVKELLTDMLNLCKVTIKDKFTGSLILGNRLSKIFTILPEHISFTDYDVHIGDSSDILKDIEFIKQVTVELMKGGLVEPKLLFDTITTESLTEFKEAGLSSIRQQKEETGQMQQLQQQVAQYEEAMKEAQNQIKQLTTQADQVKQQTLQIKQQEVQIKAEQGATKLKNDKEFKDKDLALKEKQVQAEVLQLADDNQRNNEIKNIG